MSAHIAQINISSGGVPKRLVRQARVTRLGLEGDTQAHPKIHGGPERAVCLYDLNKLLALQAEGHPIFPGALGENITIWGLEWEQVVPGAIVRLGRQVILQITRYTTPCKTIAPFFQEGDIQRVSQKAHPGWARVYARVLQEGEISIGDSVHLQTP